MSNLVGHTYTSTDNKQSHIIFSLRAILHDYSTQPVVTLPLNTLMEAAKRVDSAFGAPYQSGSHTVRDAMQDVLKMAEEITEKNPTKEVSGRTTSVYVEKCDIGWKKLTTTTWLPDILSRKQPQEEELDVDMEREVQSEYDISDVI